MYETHFGISKDKVRSYVIAPAAGREVNRPILLQSNGSGYVRIMACLLYVELC